MRDLQPLFLTTLDHFSTLFYRETFSAFSIKFAELGCAEQDEFIASLLSSGENALTEIPPQDPPMVNIAFKDCFPNVQPEDEDGEGASFEKTFLKDLRIDQTSVMSTSQQQVVCPEIELLASYCPVNMRRELLEDLLYRRCGGCLETAAGWLVEDGDFAVKLAALETVYDENGAIIKDNNASKPADPDDTIKRSIVNKYYLEAVEKTGGIDGKVKAWGEPACMPTGGKKATVRYRNGVIVSTKGDKVRSSTAAYRKRCSLIRRIASD